MKKSKKYKISTVVLLFGIILLGIMMFTKHEDKQNSNKNQTNESTANKTNMDSLKKSDITSDFFDKVNIGDTKTEVDQKLGKNQKIGETQSGYTLYEYNQEEGVIYQMYFKENILEEVGVEIVQ